jgi:hypothetical protein
MNKFVNPDLYSKIFSFLSNPEKCFETLENMGFNENTKLYKLFKEYSIIDRKTGNNSASAMADVLNKDLAFEIQELYKVDEAVRKFFNSI